MRSERPWLPCPGPQTFRSRAPGCAGWRHVEEAAQPAAAYGLRSAPQHKPRGLKSFRNRCARTQRNAGKPHVSNDMNRRFAFEGAWANVNGNSAPANTKAQPSTSIAEYK